ncbi:NUDIX hydrolase [Phenylobacterium kunshanense]|uniref:DNA mismatch repair protein MutT n=1 Tax=Phenylobacterium kunshanense TaxID=1445034 RepID=A0A328BNC3_9CAUL|nr:NUDIX hydrolase [Phenylobacterium kunshanense]RAK67444.1 DNA mismatch repair protein MutT [Phenylobacterium kunshanense]
MGKKTDRLRPEADREPRTQYAALPWRRGDGGVEMLLITSRETRRWVIPKGWPMKDRDAADAAAQEAFEEAGVVGRADHKPLGVYHYDKRLRSGRLQHVRVMVFGLEVTEERDIWPEMVERDRRWIAPAGAAGLVDEPELRALLAKFKPKAGGSGSPG